MGDRGEQYIVIIGDEGSKEKENMGERDNYWDSEMERDANM